MATKRTTKAVSDGAPERTESPDPIAVENVTGGPLTLSAQGVQLVMLPGRVYDVGEAKGSRLTQEQWSVLGDAERTRRLIGQGAIRVHYPKPQEA